MIIAIYAREDIKANDEISTRLQIEDCRRTAVKIFGWEEIEFVEYEDKHWGKCAKLMALEALKRDARAGMIDAIFTYSMKTLLGNGLEMVPYLQELANKKIAVYYSLLCKDMLIV